MNTPLSRRFAAASLLVLAAILPTRAADVPDCSLKFVPGDAAFYSASLHNRAQFEAILNSKAVGRLKELPAFKIFLKKMEAEFVKNGGSLQPYHDFVKDPQNQQLLDLAGDMLSHEFFVYGGSSFIDVLELAGKMGGLSGSMSQLADLQRGIVPDDKAQQRVILKMLADNAQLLTVPDMVIGFKLSDSARATAQLKRLDALLKEGLKQSKDVKIDYQQLKIAGGNFYSLSIDAKQFPWNELKLERLEENPGEFDKLKDRLKQLSFTVNLGVRDGYLLLSLGASNAGLEKLGKSPTLAERDEFKPLAKHADKKVIAIDYTSKALNAKAAYSKADVDNLVKQGKEFLAKADLPAKLRKRLDKDLQDLAKDLQRYLGETGASMGFSMLTPRGQESFSYDWSEHLFVDGSKPLTLLQHLGGNPILASVGRAKYDPQSYELAVKWIKVANKYFEEYAVPKMGDDEKAQYEQFKKIGHPLLDRLDKATRTQVMPALADGQAAFVLDGKWKSKGWTLFTPTEEELTLPELAIIYGVSDADLLRKGLDAYREVFNDAAAALNNATGGTFPDLKLHAPDTRKVKNGTMYYYTIPPFLDPQVLPNGGLADKVAVFSFSEKHTERILTPTPLAVDGGPLGDAKRNLAGASYFSMVALVDMLNPWVEYATRQAMAQEQVDEKGVNEVIKQVRVVLDVLKCLESASSATYLEGKALVTHTELRVRDR